MTEPHRIVCTLASATELVAALGMGDRLIGRSHECDHPAWVERLPVVSRPTFPVSGSSREIDELVRSRLHAGQPLYEVDEALLLRLAPDLVITQTHCEVCAVSPGDLAHGTPGRLARERVLALGASTLDGILDDFGRVAEVLGRAQEGRDLVADIRSCLSRLEARTRTLRHPTLVCLEWIDPIFAMGNWGPELVTIAGGTSVLGNAGLHSTTTTWDAIKEADPEVLVVAPCGFKLERALSEMPTLSALPGWRQLRAVREDRVYVANGNLYFNRSGPALFDTPQILAEILHPDVFPPHHEGDVWRRWL